MRDMPILRAMMPSGIKVSVPYEKCLEVPLVWLFRDAKATLEHKMLVEPTYFREKK